MKKFITFLDFIDRVMIKCLIEGIFVGIFSLLAMLAASADGWLAHMTQIVEKKRFKKNHGQLSS